MFVGDHVCPRGRRPLPFIQNRDVLAPFLGKAAQAIEKLQTGNTDGGFFGVNARGKARGERPRHFVVFRRTPRELFFERATVGDEDNARHGVQENLVFIGHDIRAQDINPAGLILQCLQARRTQQRLNLIL